VVKLLRFENNAPSEMQSFFMEVIFFGFFFGQVCRNLD